MAPQVRLHDRGAEWMVFRFGEGLSGQFARVVRVIAIVMLTVGMLAYLVKGIGLFLSMFLPFSPFVCSLIMIGIASIYTMASGFYGVVFTDMFQSFIILTSVIAISAMAMAKSTDVHSLGCHGTGGHRKHGMDILRVPMANHDAAWL